MKRVLAIAFVLVVSGVAALVAAGAGSDAKGQEYKIEFDNAFGLTPKVDVKVGGVRAGSVSDLDVDRKTAHAIVTVTVSQPGFSRFKSDARCAIKPQSLIGEYFVDCQPGQSDKPLPRNTVPVEQTETTIPPDIVQNILRRPYRERFALIFNEFGAALAGRAPDLNATIRRAIPALNETDRALKVLADNRATLQSLTRNSAVVLSQLADRKKDVSRFVSEARNAASASADRRTDLATTIRRFPGFLAELRPTLRDLGTAAREQTPALADLGAASTDLTAFFNRLGPFSKASLPALESLGEASKLGIPAARSARPTIAQLRGLTKSSPELANNLAIVLEHINDRKFAVEKNPLSPGGAGFTGLEAFLQYPFVQSQAINIFDQRGYILKLLLLANDCSAYTNADSARKDPERTKKCNGYLGPNQPGVNQPDPSGAASTATAARKDSRATRRSRSRGGRKQRSGAKKPGITRPGSGGGSPSRPSTPGASPTPSRPSSPLDDALKNVLPDVKTPSAPSTPATPQTDRGLLDFLLGP